LELAILDPVCFPVFLKKSRGLADAFEMDNRRRYYRHSFIGPPLLQATLSSAGGPESRRGEIVNLSVGGMALRLEDQTFLASASQWTIGVCLNRDTPLLLQATLVHQATDNNPSYGFQFHSLAETHANEEREKVIWSFLLDEQRKARRQRRG
jgi:c-di-GMP-binding flagellar brake protein YcgR